MITVIMQLENGKVQVAKADNEPKLMTRMGKWMCKGIIVFGEPSPEFMVHVRSLLQNKECFMLNPWDVEEITEA